LQYRSYDRLFVLWSLQCHWHLANDRQYNIVIERTMRFPILSPY
jgi:hypothetical protein